jgi:hypothetical protein
VIDVAFVEKVIKVEYLMYCLLNRRFHCVMY